MKRFYRVLGLIILLSLIIQNFSGIRVFAYEVETPKSPTRFRVEKLKENQPPIGFDEFDKYYVDLKWDMEVTGGVFYNLYLQEAAKGYRPVTSRVLKERDIPGSDNSIRLKELKSGTIYNLDMTAYRTETDEGKVYKSLESGISNKVKVLTDIDIAAYSHRTDQIKIEWDDVWDTQGRISYKLYISENDSFTNTQPIYIGNSQIGEGKAVTVNEENGKLEYIHNVRDAGRVYYVRIEPDIGNDEIKRTQYTKTVKASSFILVKTSRVAYSDMGVIWKLEWSPVVTGLSSSGIKVAYQIYRGTIGSNTLEQYMAETDGTNFFITLPEGEVTQYFLIRAIVTKDGQDVYRGIRIESDQIIVEEQETPTTPTTPEIVDLFERVAGDVIVSYEEELTSTGATILWKAPIKGNGELDSDVTYDIWLVTDPNTLDAPLDSEKIASDFMVGSANHIINNNKVIGYKYRVEGLTQNSTYYFKIVAKKKAIENVNGVVQSVTYQSDAALKVIITPIDEPIDQPVIPARPPLKIKENSQGEYMVTENSVTIQLKNLWYEKFNFADNKWEYIANEELNNIGFDNQNGTGTTVVNDVYYRKVAYDSGVTFDVGCIEYVEGMKYEDIQKLQPDKVTKFPTTANDATENPNLNPDGMRHNVVIDLTDLEPNKIYVIWARAVRSNANLASGPSDPIVFTTLPIIITPVEKPVVPYFNYSLGSDNYIDIGWDIVPEYNYYLKYGLEDNVNTAKNQITITAQELKEIIYYRVKDLQPDTLYYFWIQAEAVNTAGESSKSDWSDSYAVRTSELIPPETPKGFGIKNSKDAITKNAITYEWMMEENIQYILEIASDINYTNSSEYDAGMGSEYTVKELLSNHRYYARLYAYDPNKKLRSEPTQSITVRTNRSGDDYDSDEDIEDIITGEFVEKDKEIINDTWNIRITGVNADRFAQRVLTDNKLDYRLDVSTPPSKCNVISILISDKVFKALTSIGENLIIKTKKVNLIIRPGVLTTNISYPLVNINSGVDYEITISTSEVSGDGIKNMDVKLEAGNFKFSALEGANKIPVNKVLKPLKFEVMYDKENWYSNGKTSGFVYDSGLTTWTRESTFAVYDRDTNKGKLTFETFKPGDTIVAQYGNDYFDDIYYHSYEAVINNVAAAHDIKSINGRLFGPDLNAAIGDSVKLMFDALDYRYGSNYMNEAFKSGLIGYDDINLSGKNCTASKAYSMIIRSFEIKSGTILGSEKKSNFIANNGFTIIREGKAVLSDTVVNRGEIMYLIEKLLVFIGEID